MLGLKQIKAWFNYVLDRVIDLCNMFLMDAYQLPWPVAQTTAHQLARYIGDLCWLISNFPRVSVYELTGPDWRIVFVGEDEGRKEISHLFFDEEVRQRELGRMALWSLSVQSQRWLAEGVDLVICELSRIHNNFRKVSFTFAVPSWIQQVVDIPETLEVLISGGERRSLRHRIHRAKKAGFTYRFSQSKSDFDHFYCHMYLPFVKSRHADLALVTPYHHQWRRWFKRGGLIIANQNNKPVAGVLCYISNGTCFPIEEGVLEADTRIIRQDINTFLIWSAAAWAHEQDARTLDLGGSHAYRSNGAFAYKRRWRARVARRKRIYSTWTFLAQNPSPSLQDHINRLGFITEIDGGFYGVLLSNDAMPVSEDEIAEELKAAERDGLDGLVLVTAHNHRIVPCYNKDDGR